MSWPLKNKTTGHGLSHGHPLSPCRWVLLLTMNPNPKEQTPKACPTNTDPLGGRAVPGKLKWEMMDHRTPWISFPASLDAKWILELLWEAKTWGLSIPEPKIWRIATNAVIYSMDEGAFGNLCVFLFFFPFFFLHLLVKVYFCSIQTGSWEVLSDSVHFKAACDLSSF